MSEDYTRFETDEQAFELPEPNPETARLHRKDFRREILTPILMSVLALVGVCLIFWFAGVGTAGRWASISTIFMLLPGLLIGLIVLAVMVALVFALGELLKILPRYTRLAQDAVEQIKEQVEAGADLAAQPVIQVKSYVAMIDRLFGFFKKG